MVSTIASIVLCIALITLGYILSYNGVLMLDVTFVFLGTLMLTAIAIEVSLQDEPFAIDVYRGKTTLKISYVDSVAVDSVVVFKEQ